MSDITTPAGASIEGEKQESSVLDGIDPVSVVLNAVTNSLKEGACDATAAVVSEAPAAAVEATAEASSSIVSEVMSGIGDAVGTILDGI